MNNANTIHPFELAGLGKAPFRFVGMESQDMAYGERILNRAEFNRTGIALTTKPGGTCAYCGTYILNMYKIESADGKRFHVGCDCVEKTGDKHLVKVVSDANKKADRIKKDNKSARVLAELKELIADETNGAKLKALPHPNAYMANKGVTLLDWVHFVITGGGSSGHLRALNTVKKVIG